MTPLDKAVIWWHRILFHDSAYSMNGRLWRCSCGATIGRWTMEL